MGPEPKKYAGLPSKERFIISKLNSPSVHSSQRSLLGSIRSTKSSLGHAKSSLTSTWSKKKVLDESDYLHELSGVIKRDYYPDLPQHEAALVSPHLTLSTFDTHYTSHDNQSFRRLLEKANEKRKSRLKLLEQAQLKSLTHGTAAPQGMSHLLLPPARSQRLLLQDARASPQLSLAKSSPKQSVHRENTRLPTLKYIGPDKTEPLPDVKDSWSSFVDENVDDKET